MKLWGEIKQVPPHTLITGVAAIAWLASFGLRAVFPGFALGPAADTLMATCVAWWMKQNKATNPDGLMNDVLEKVALPYIQTAHSPVPASAPAYSPKPVQPPAPKPAAPTTTRPPGGLPWE